MLVVQQDVDFRFNEDKILQDALDYITRTYSQHYASESNGKNVQVIDMWDAMGSLFTTSRDTCLKYLARIGKKDGYNQKDLLKAMHYLVLMIYSMPKEQPNSNTGRS